MNVRIQEADFDLGAELAAMRCTSAGIGAIASFVGLVRDSNDGSQIATMTLEHYPGMTEKALASIVAEAATRWDILETRIIHRIGRLEPSDQIVLVAVSSAHRREAFAACEFIMDWLKTSAPFWKREETEAGARWVEAKESDATAAERWK